MEELLEVGAVLKKRARQHLATIHTQTLKQPIEYFLEKKRKEKRTYF